MADMLAALYDLPDSSELYKELADKGIKIMRAMTPNKYLVEEYLRENHSEGITGEVMTAFCHHPVSCFIAFDTEAYKIVGYAAYDCTYRGFFGPTAVHADYRGKNIGTALLMRTLEAMRDEGYAYAIIGGVGGAKAFYEKKCGATVIENSTPGIYKDWIRKKQ